MTETTLIPCLGCGESLSLISIGSGTDTEAPEMVQFRNSVNVWFGIVRDRNGDIMIVGAHRQCINKMEGFEGIQLP